VACATPTSPVVIIIALPTSMASVEVGDAMERRGFLLSYQSQYLQRWDWLKLCLMGADALGGAEIIDVVDALDTVTMRDADVERARRPNAPTQGLAAG